MQVMWFFPTAGDGRSLSPSAGRRKTDYAYLKQIAIAADTLGYYGALLPTGLDCEEAWVLASSFILSGYPHLEEAYRFAELVFPHLPLRQ